LNAGCSLIDTAPNYAHGESESLIGSVLDNYARHRIFVITKVGYVSGDDFDFFRSADGAAARRGLKILDDNSGHCIHPDYLKYRIYKSLRLLRSEYADAILLHNPEYQFGGEDPPSELRRMVIEAFEFFEGLAKKKVIRYYGVSSNDLPLHSDRSRVKFAELVKWASSVASVNNFKIIQFPFNLAEWEAALTNANEPSLIWQAKYHDICTISNRPLNAKFHERQIRLAGTGVAESSADISEPFSCICNTLNSCMKDGAIEGEIESIPQIARFKSAITLVGDPEIASQLFRASFLPVVQAIFPTGVPDYVQELLVTTNRQIMNIARSTMASAARAFMLEQHIHQRAGSIGDRPLHVSACEALLSAGVDHVLVGMRRPEYVADFCQLFTPLSEN
jgi:aryl-alcohol dehydrogenase-like predicted oxidoreductase